MKVQTQKHQNGKLQVVIPGYYRQLAHTEKPYTDGMYGKVPPGSAKDFWCDQERWCKDWMEWAYNNPYQPSAEWSEHFQNYQPFLDASHANATYNLGSLKNIWKEFELSHNLHALSLMEIDINQLEEKFWEYYMKHYSSNYWKGVQVLEDYVRTRRMSMTPEERALEQKYIPIFADDANWIAGCQDYIKHLIYTSPRGYLMELILFAALREVYGGKFVESDEDAERKGIDGYLELNGEKIAISLKPDSYSRGYASPLHDACWVTYYKKNAYYPDLVFEFKQGQEKLGA